VGWAISTAEIDPHLSMKHIRNLTVRGVLVPLALLALVIASSVPASASPLTVTTPDSVRITIGSLSMNW
jgi:hypothetical protein